jgi:hypothetical protein
VISDLPGVIEQAQDAALRFDPDDPVDIANKLGAVLRNREIALELIAAGHRRMEELNYDYYRSALGCVFDDMLVGPELGKAPAAGLHRPSRS